MVVVSGGGGSGGGIDAFEVVENGGDSGQCIGSTCPCHTVTIHRENNSFWCDTISSVTVCSSLTAIKLAVASGDLISVGANTMARFSELIMFLLCCSTTLQRKGTERERLLCGHSLQFQYEGFVFYSG